MIIYVMRHGTTVWNEKEITQGHSQNRLSKTGKKLVEEQAESFIDKVDVIFSSPLMRTMQTANIMNKKLKVKIIKDERLIEINQGIFTGRKKSSLTEEEKLIKNERSSKYGIETFQSVYNRIKDFLEYLKTFKYKSVLIVTHNAGASSCEQILNNAEIDFKDFKNFHLFGNAEIKRFEFKNI